MSQPFGNPGEGTTEQLPLPVELFDNYGPAFFHEEALSGTVENEGFKFEWMRGFGMLGLSLQLSDMDDNIISTAYLNEVDLAKALATILINRQKQAKAKEGDGADAPS